MRPKYTPLIVTAHLNRVEQEWYDRFWEQVEKTPTCWLWRGSLDDSGYGRVNWFRQSFRCHRFSYEMEHGPIPRGLVVMHICDIRPCVRPSHLTLGTIADTNNDRDAKGRSGIALMGTANPKAKLTEAQVREIRSRWTGEYGQATALMREFGIKAPALYGIIRRTAWKHVT